MNTISRTISGAVFILAGTGVTVLVFIESAFYLIYAVPLILIGAYLVFNIKEDEIEQIKE